MIITWKHRTSTYQGSPVELVDFIVNGKPYVGATKLSEYVTANHYRYRRVTVLFPKGEPSPKADYWAPYLGLAKACYEYCIPVFYITSDGKPMRAHVLTWVDYDGVTDPEEAQYVLDRVNLGTEKQAVDLIKRQDIKPPDFIQVICPWTEYPSDFPHYPPDGMSELEKHFQNKGVRVEYHEERYTHFLTPPSGKPAKPAPAK